MIPKRVLMMTRSTGNKKENQAVDLEETMYESSMRLLDYQIEAQILKEKFPEDLKIKI